MMKTSDVLESMNLMKHSSLSVLIFTDVRNFYLYGVNLILGEKSKESCRRAKNGKKERKGWAKYLCWV